LFTIQTVPWGTPPFEVALNCTVWPGKRTAVAGVMVAVGPSLTLPELHPIMKRRSK
jgi:hypothetical protein